MAYYDVYSPPSLSSSTPSIGTRSINVGAFELMLWGSSTGITRYYWYRIYNNTTGTVIHTGVRTNSGHGTSFVSVSPKAQSLAPPTSTTNNIIVIQDGRTSSSSKEPTNWDTIWSGSVSVSGKATYNIIYYNRNGSVFSSTTGGEGDNHTVIAGTGIGGFDHWNTSADDTGTSYSPGATRFIDGDLYFYAICNGIIVRRKINGEWKNCSVQAKVNGEWVPVIEGYIKVNGVWKPIV